MIVKIYIWSKTDITYELKIPAIRICFLKNPLSDAHEHTVQ